MSAPATGLPPLSLGRRRQLLTLVVLVVGALALGWAAWQWLVARHYESTDNAYVQGNVVQITPQVGGTVVAILAEDTDFVRAGQPLVRLDPADAALALDQAKAQLGQTVRQVRALYAESGSLAAHVALRQAEAARARSEVARTGDDLRRRETLAESGAISREELNHARTALENARNALAAAEAAVVAAREQLAGNRTLTEGTTVEQHPNVQAAAARMKEAWVAARRGVVAAPVDGQVARRTVQLGQKIAAGAALMSVVPLRQVWVDANFKEAQLRNIRIGQPVKLTADQYGDQVEFDGRVAGLGAGTGAAFALLPAQNATGNWIKVVQRIPVRVTLDPAQLAAHPLRVGLSMQARVDVRDRQGKALADAPRVPPPEPPPSVPPADAEAEEAVRGVIEAHAGGARAAVRSMAGGGR